MCQAELAAKILQNIHYKVSSGLYHTLRAELAAKMPLIGTKISGQLVTSVARKHVFYADQGR
jgi:hypothetical protein